MSYINTESSYYMILYVKGFVSSDKSIETYHPNAALKWETDAVNDQLVKKVKSNIQQLKSHTFTQELVETKAELK